MIACSQKVDEKMIEESNIEDEEIDLQADKRSEERRVGKECRL